MHWKKKSFESNENFFRHLRASHLFKRNNFRFFQLKRKLEETTIVPFKLTLTWVRDVLYEMKKGNFSNYLWRTKKLIGNFFEELLCQLTQNFILKISIFYDKMWWDFKSKFGLRLRCLSCLEKIYKPFRHS